MTILMSCADHPLPREGRREQDLSTDSGEVDTGGRWPGDGPTTPDTTPEPVGEVCYPGEGMDDTTCVPVVDHRDGWGADYDYPPPYNDSPQYDAPVRFVDLSVVDPGLALAPNFVLDEFMQEYKGRYAIFQPHVVSSLQELRDRVGGPVVVNSGYRNVSYNAGVGGATYSRHMYGDAVDIASSSASLDELADICESLGAAFISTYTSHVHCDWRDDPLEPAFFDTDGAQATSSHARTTATILHDGDHLQIRFDGFDEGVPLIYWTALDADGQACATGTGDAFLPPSEAVSVSAWVGRQIWLSTDVNHH